MSGTWMAGCWLPSNDHRVSSSVDYADCTTYSVDVCNSFSALSSMVSQIHHTSLESPSGMDNKENENMSQPQEKKRIVYVDESACNSVISNDDCTVVCAESDSTPAQINNEYSAQMTNEECSTFCETSQIPSAAVLSCINDASVDAKNNGSQPLASETSNETGSKDSSMPKLERIDHCNMPTCTLKQKRKYTKELSNSPMMPILEKQTYAEMDDNLKRKTRSKRMKYCTPNAIHTKQHKRRTTERKHPNVRSSRKRNNSFEGRHANEKDIKLKLRTSDIYNKKNCGNSLTVFSSDAKIGKEYVLVEKLDPMKINYYVSVFESKCMLPENRSKGTRPLNLRKRKNKENGERSSNKHSDTSEQTVPRSKRRKIMVAKSTQSKYGFTKPLSQKPQPCNLCNSEPSVKHCWPKYAKNLSTSQVVRKRTSKRKVSRRETFDVGKKSVVQAKATSKNTEYNFRNLRSSSKSIKTGNSETVTHHKRKRATNKQPSRDSFLRYTYVVKDQMSISNKKVKTKYQLSSSCEEKLNKCQFVKANFMYKLSDNAQQLLKACKKLTIQLQKIDCIPEHTSNVDSSWKNVSSVLFKSVFVKPQVKCRAALDTDRLKNMCSTDKESAYVQDVKVIPKVKRELNELKNNVGHGRRVEQTYCEENVPRSDKNCSGENGMHLNSMKCKVSQPDLATSESLTYNDSEVSCCLDGMCNESANFSFVQKYDSLKKSSKEYTPNSEVNVSCSSTTGSDTGSNLNKAAEQLGYESDELYWCINKLTKIKITNSRNSDVEMPSKNVMHYSNGTSHNLGLDINLREGLNNTDCKHDEVSCDLSLAADKRSGKPDVLIHLTDSIDHSNLTSLDSNTKYVLNEPSWELTSQHVNQCSTSYSQKEMSDLSTTEFTDAYVTNCGAISLTSLPNRCLSYSNQNYVNIGNDTYFEYAGVEKKFSSFPDDFNSIDGVSDTCNMQSLFLQEGSSASNRALNFDTKSTHVSGDSFKRDVGMNTVCCVSAATTSQDDQPPCSQLEDQDLYALEFDNLFDEMIIPVVADNNNSNRGTTDLPNDTLITNNVGNNLDTGSSLNIFEEIEAGILYPNVGESTDESLTVQASFLEGEENARLSEILSYLKEPSL